MKIDKSKRPDDIYAALPPDEQLVALILRDFVLETVDRVKEKLAWGAPFYYRHGQICFIWPASVPWGKLDSGVALGFPRAKYFEDTQVFGDQKLKTVARLIFHRPEELDFELLTQLLREAVAVDELLWQKRGGKA